MTALDVAFEAPVADPVAAAWQRRRSELLHDWLRNRFLPRVQAGIVAAAPGTRMAPSLLESFHGTVREWPECSAEILALTERCCEVMSPRRMAEGLAPALGGRAAAFVHATALELWALRGGIRPLLAEIHDACGEADAAYARWAAEASSESLRLLAAHAERVAVALRKLPARVTL